MPIFFYMPPDMLAQAIACEIGDRMIENPMSLQRCFDILELSPGATREEARRAYKDIVNVWHPDRFSNNPRLRKKAEIKLKEINAAYEEIGAFMASRDTGKHGEGPGSSSTPGRSRNAEDNGRDTVEAMAEAGTRLVLGRLVLSRKNAGPVERRPGRRRKNAPLHERPRKRVIPHAEFHE